jgi:hypothetical protein
VNVRGLVFDHATATPTKMSAERANAIALIENVGCLPPIFASRSISLDITSIFVRWNNLA